MTDTDGHGVRGRADLHASIPNESTSRMDDSSTVEPNHLTHGPVSRALFNFMLPMLLGNVLQSLNGSVNAMWVGHNLGETALTATANANTLLFFLVGSVFGIGMAATILVAQRIGANDIGQAKQVVGTSVVFFGVMSLLVAGFGLLFARHLMQAMGTPSDALSLAVAYLRIMFVGLPFQFAYVLIMMVLRGAGDTRTPFRFQWLSVGLDIVLNPLFIFGWGPLPALGIAGSAAATLVAQSVSLAALVWTLYRRNHELCLRRGEGRYLRPDPAILRALVIKGLPMGLNVTVVSLSHVAMFSLVNRFGSQTSAAYGACLQLWNYLQMPAMAVGMAASSMAAQNIGAKRWNRLGRIVLAGSCFNLVMTGGLVLLISLFSQQVLGLFLPTLSPALQVARHINALVAWSYVFLGLTFVLSGVMRASGAVMAPLLILSFAFWGVRLPLAVMFYQRWGANALWWSFGAGSVTAAVMSIGYFRLANWQAARMMVPAAT